MTIQADQDQLLIPIENFAQRLKSIKCGPDVKGLTMVFNDKNDFAVVQKRWKWVDEKDPNNFIIVTEMDQCYKGDDRSPYAVKSMKFDEATLTVSVDASEQPWEIIKTGEIQITNEYVDPATQKQTHPQLIRRAETLDLGFTKSITLFDWKKDSKETAGLGIKANVHVITAGAIVADINLKWGGLLGASFKGFTADFKPKGLSGSLVASIDVDGKLGKAIDFAGPEWDIPIGGFSIAKVFSVGPVAGVGVHFGSTAIEGTATVSVGAKGKIPDSAVAHFDSDDKSKNKVDGWKPSFEKIDPRLTAEVKAGLKAWAELSFKLKATALKWGFEAGVVAEIPYFEANAAVKADTKQGVCGTNKAVGIELNCEVGINVDLELDVGKIDGDPVFNKNLFATQWPLYSTCMGVGKDIQTSSVADVPKGPGKTKSSSEGASATSKPSGSSKPASNSASATAKPTSGSAKPSSASPKPSSGSSKPSSASAQPSSDKPQVTSSAKASSGSSKPSSAPAVSSSKPAVSVSSGKASASESLSLSMGISVVKPSSSAASATASAPASVKPSASASASVKPSVSASASPSVKPSASASAPASASSSLAAPAPTGGASYSTAPTAAKFEGAVSTCKKWYTVKAGEDCSSSGLSTPDLCKLNKGLESSCSNLMSGVAYCVQG